MLQIEDNDNLASFATVRPSPAKFPTSLRVLFDNDVSNTSDPFRIPGFGNGGGGPSASPSISTPPLALPNTISSPPARDRGAIKRAMTTDGILDDVPALNKATFAFPPPVTPRARSRMGTNASNPVEGGISDPLESNREKSSASISRRGRHVGDSSLTDFNFPATGSNATKAGQTFRDIRSSRGPADIEIPPQSSETSLELGPSPLPPVSDSNPTTASSSLTTTDSRASSRNRSQSGVPNSRSLHPPAPDDKRVNEFHFPAIPSPSPPGSGYSSGRDEHSSTLAPTSKTHDRTSPTHASVSSLTTSPQSVHHPTHSLDVPPSVGLPRRMPPPGSLPPLNSIVRSRSATPSDGHVADYNISPHPGRSVPPSRKPSLSRLASVAVMETVQPPMTPPTKPFATPVRKRSGSSTSGMSDITGLPGLKDVLKVRITFFTFSMHFFSLHAWRSALVFANTLIPQIPSLSSEHHLGMSADLLPPSPSAVITNIRLYNHTASNLSTFTTLSDPTPTLASSPLPNVASSESPTARGLPTITTRSPPHSSHPTDIYFPASAAPSSSPKRSDIHRQNGSLATNSLMSNSLRGPTVRPLDFVALMSSHDETHAELARIVDDLASWLSVTEQGLTRMLENASEDRIEEEQEELAGTDIETTDMTSGRSSPALALDY